MSQVLNSMRRKALVAAGAITLSAAGVFTYVAHADDMKKDGMPMMPMSAENKKMMTDSMSKMKAMMADPAQAEAMKMKMAKMMVMDQMVKMMASDPECKQMCMDMMKDPAMGKLHDDAMMMAKDPAMMKKMQTEIMADSDAMMRVNHESMMMHMMNDKMGGMDDKKMDNMEKK